MTQMENQASHMTGYLLFDVLDVLLISKFIVDSDRLNYIKQFDFI